MKYPFVNCEGKVVKLDGKLTLADLTRMGIKLKMEPKGRPLPKNPKVFIHPPPKKFMSG